MSYLYTLAYLYIFIKELKQELEREHLGGAERKKERGKVM